MLEGWGRVKRKIFIKGFKTLSRCSCALCPTNQPKPQLKNSETITLSCCVMWHLFSVYLPTPLCLHTSWFWPLTTSSLCLAAIILNLKCKKRILWQPNSFHTFCPDSQMSSEQRRRWKKCIPTYVWNSPNWFCLDSASAHSLLKVESSVLHSCKHRL